MFFLFLCAGKQHYQRHGQAGKNHQGDSAFAGKTKHLSSASAGHSSASDNDCDMDKKLPQIGADRKSPVFRFEQKDFAQGPLRIKVPGTYRAKYPSSGPRKIVYNPDPNSMRTDVPFTGQICAISVECSGVTIDLNGGVLETGDNVFSAFPPGSKASALFLNYATILLANAAFPAFIANTPVPGGLMRFLDSPAYLAGQNISIENGEIVNSPHFGIFGPQGHSHVAIKNLCVKGCVISGITINSTDVVLLKNVSVDGKMTKAVNFHLPTSHLVATKQLVDQTLQQVPNDPVLLPLSTALQADVGAAYAAEAKGLTSTVQSTTTQYGIVVQNGASSPFTAYLNRTLAAQINQVSGLSNVGQVHMDNVSVCNINNSNTEVPLIGYSALSYTESDNNSPMFGKPWAGTQGSILLLRNVNPFAQTLKWEDLGVQPDGSLQPNNFIKANAYLMLLAQNTPASPSIVIHPGFVQALLAPNPTLNSIIPFVQPVFGLSPAGDFLRGTTAVVVRGFGSANCRNIDVSNLSNTSLAPLQLADIPGGSAYTNSNLLQNANFGAVVWGIFFQAGEKVCLDNCRVRNLRSTQGNVFATHFIDVEAFHVKNVRVKGLQTSGAASGAETYVYQVLEADFQTESSENTNAQGKIKRLSRSSLTSPITARS